MDLTNVIGAIFNGGKSTQQKAGGIDIAEIIKLVMAAKGSSNSGSAANGIDIASILKQLGGKDNGALASVILQQVLASKMGQNSSNSSLGNMNTTDIAGAAKSAADILKGILGSK